MTPTEFQTRFTAGLPVTLVREPVYRISYSATVAGQNLAEEIGFVGSKDLGEAIVAKRPANLKLEQLDYVKLTNPDEADPKVPLFLLALPQTGYLTEIDTIDGSRAAEFALLTAEQAATVIERFIPILGG